MLHTDQLVEPPNSQIKWYAMHPDPYVKPPVTKIQLRQNWICKSRQQQLPTGGLVFPF